jgi:hypothetical protein
MAATVHEEVHQRAERQDRPGERLQHMRSVFREEQISGRGQEAQEDDPPSRPSVAALRGRLAQDL